MKKYLFLFYLIFYYSFLFIYSNYLNIGNLEIYYLSQNYPITYIEKIFLETFGNNNFILRLPSLILSIISIYLYYNISKKYLKKDTDVYLSVIIFSLIPGFIISSLLFNKSIYLIFLVLLFLYTFIYYRLYSYIFLLLYSITDYSFISLYFGLIFYSIYNKSPKLLIYSIILFAINANYFNYSIDGHPTGHFIDIILIYFAIFSPLVFIYFLYSLIRVIKYPTILWFISSWGLVFSFLLSFRQKIKIDDYAPFVIVSVIFMVSIFLNGYRVRLKAFRPTYRLLFVSLLSSLILFDVFILYSPFIIHKKIVEQFRYSYDISVYLKNHNIDDIQCNNKVFCNKLYFYGIQKGKEYYIYWDKKNKKVSISHNNKKILDFYVSKLNKKSKKMIK